MKSDWLESRNLSEWKVEELNKTYKTLHKIRNIFYFLWFALLILELGNKLPGTGYSLTMFAFKTLFELHRDEYNEFMTEEVKDVNRKILTGIIVFILIILICNIVISQTLTKIWEHVLISSIISVVISLILQKRNSSSASWRCFSIYLFIKSYKI